MSCTIAGYDGFVDVDFEGGGATEAVSGENHVDCWLDLGYIELIFIAIQMILVIELVFGGGRKSG